GAGRVELRGRERSPVGNRGRGTPGDGLVGLVNRKGDRLRGWLVVVRLCGVTRQGLRARVEDSARRRGVGQCAVTGTGRVELRGRERGAVGDRGRVTPGDGLVGLVNRKGDRLRGWLVVGGLCGVNCQGLR